MAAWEDFWGYTEDPSGEDRVSNCGVIRAGDHRSALRQTRFVVASEETCTVPGCLEWHTASHSQLQRQQQQQQQPTVDVNLAFTRLYVRQSGLDVDNMSATNDIRTTRMHRMARRAVWRLFMNSRRGLKRRCPQRYNNMVKEKANSIRIYDSEGYRRRAACICVKNDLEDEVGQPADGSSRYFCRHVYRSLVFSTSYSRERIIFLSRNTADFMAVFISWFELDYRRDRRARQFFFIVSYCYFFPLWIAGTISYI